VTIVTFTAENVDLFLRKQNDNHSKITLLYIYIYGFYNDFSYISGYIASNTRIIKE
jgi:hypothetical protein